MSPSNHRLLCLTGLLACAGAAHAADAPPPIKPGLWQVHSERVVDGKKMAAPGAQLGTMTPDMRARVESMMKQRGVDMNGGGDIKLCLNKESLDSGQWQGRAAAVDVRCKTDYGTRTAKGWKWHSVCTEPKSETDGEALFESPESYTVKVAVTSTVQGKPHTTNVTNTSKWLGADCGGLKPVSPKTMGAPVGR